jgi:predicted transcriptional regulator YdeE
LFQFSYNGGVEFVRLEHFSVIGIEGRTSNAREATAQGLIGKMWQRFRSENLAARIPHRADSNLVAVYSEYEGDENGEYTFTLGAKVSGISEVPQGLSVRQVPTARYAVFTTERGPVNKVVADTWKRIWAERRSGAYARSYQADFEQYGADAKDPANSRVTIYVGVRDQ